jgi:hypothetical protein
MLSLGAIAFEESGNPAYANDLWLAPIKASQWGVANLNKTFHNSGQLAVGDLLPIFRYKSIGYFCEPGRPFR